MTTLADIITQPLPPLETLRSMWLAFPAELCQQIDEAQSNATTVRVSPIYLTDGRACLCADVLSEIHEGGVFAAQFAQLDASNFAQVEVLDDTTFRALQPPSDDI
jgi:hypothetical protein